MAQDDIEQRWRVYEIMAERWPARPRFSARSAQQLSVAPVGQVSGHHFRRSPNALAAKISARLNRTSGTPGL
jgi:hypothetical protein